MEVCSGQNHDNKIAPQVNLNPTAANIMDLLCIFVITKLNNTFFSVLVIILATWIIFVIIIRIFFFHPHHELFFSGTFNYFSNVYRSRIIFFIGRRIIFRGIANLSFSLQCILGLAAEGNWFDCLISFASILKTVQAAECFQRESKGETLPGKETKEVSIFSFKIWEEPVVCAKVMRFSGPKTW